MLRHGHIVNASMSTADKTPLAVPQRTQRLLAAHSDKCDGRTPTEGLLQSVNLYY